MKIDPLLVGGLLFVGTLGGSLGGLMVHFSNKAAKIPDSAVVEAAQRMKLTDVHVDPVNLFSTSKTFHAQSGSQPVSGELKELIGGKRQLTVDMTLP
jgi:hypothetical protein